MEILRDRVCKKLRENSEVSEKKKKKISEDSSGL